MDDVPERREDDVTDGPRIAAPRPELTGPATDRVRIVGAEPAGEATSAARRPRTPSTDDGRVPAAPGPTAVGPASSMRIGESSAATDR